MREKGDGKVCTYFLSVTEVARSGAKFQILGVWPGSRKFFPLESRICEIFACGIEECGSTNNWNGEIKNPESRMWSPESKTVLDSLIWARWFANLSSSGGEWLTRQR